MDNIYNQIKELWDAFEENHQAHSEKGNKAAGTRARKALSEITKLAKVRRKEIQEAKSTETASA